MLSDLELYPRWVPPNIGIDCVESVQHRAARLLTVITAAIVAFHLCFNTDLHWPTL